MLLQLNMTKWCKTEYHSKIQNTTTPHKSKSESETESVCPGFHFHFCRCLVWWSCKSLQGKNYSLRCDTVPSPSWSSWPHRAEISLLLCQGYIFYSSALKCWGWVLGTVDSFPIVSLMPLETFLQKTTFLLVVSTILLGVRCLFVTLPNWSQKSKYFSKRD